MHKNQQTQAGYVYGYHTSSTNTNSSIVYGGGSSGQLQPGSMTGGKRQAKYIVANTHHNDNSSDENHSEKEGEEEITHTSVKDAHAGFGRDKLDEWVMQLEHEAELREQDEHTHRHRSCTDMHHAIGNSSEQHRASEASSSDQQHLQHGDTLDPFLEREQALSQAAAASRFGHVQSGYYSSGYGPNSSNTGGSAVLEHAAPQRTAPATLNKAPPHSCISNSNSNSNSSSNSNSNSRPLPMLAQKGIAAGAPSRFLLSDYVRT
jgi:hypothetical protein